ncbi:unnamed protein product [Prorocentrum cordatum]|uniref:Glutaminase n=1 Tax=Prorocentrum cordatum TaxID=2364126 RepID=A0ABN9RKB3_9DINO|nr:unnamed protein product [Polarella glacialis]
MAVATASRYEVPTDTPDALPPSFWPTHASRLGAGAPADLRNPGYGEPKDGRPSSFYHYPDAVFSDAISTTTREWLRACWTDVDRVREMMLQSGEVLPFPAVLFQGPTRTQHHSLVGKTTSCEVRDVHQGNANGFTGLHMAALKHKVDIAALLLEKGHDVNIEECNGLTPLDYCIDSALTDGMFTDKHGSQSYVAMVELLESRGAVRRQERAWLTAANQERFAPNLP